jgi:hypothetical protein
MHEHSCPTRRSSDLLKDQEKAEKLIAKESAKADAKALKEAKKVEKKAIKEAPINNVQ